MISTSTLYITTTYNTITYVYHPLTNIYIVGTLGVWSFWVWHVLFVYIGLFILSQIVYNYVT